MNGTCRVCGQKTSASANEDYVCDVCARAAAEYVLEQPPQLVRRFWDADDSFAQRREHFLTLAPARNAHVGASDVYAGLAVGYLAIGHRTDATLVAALSVRTASGGPCCSDPVRVLFDDRLLRTELATELAQMLKVEAPTPERSERPGLDTDPRRTRWSG